jgi:hypothetical protein
MSVESFFVLTATAYNVVCISEARDSGMSLSRAMKMKQKM